MVPGGGKQRTARRRSAMARARSFGPVRKLEKWSRLDLFEGFILVGGLVINEGKCGGGKELRKGFVVMSCTDNADK